MKPDLYISKYVIIRNNKVYVNGALLIDKQNEMLKFRQFAKSVYSFYNVKYPKYFKMDNHCKLGFLGTEILLQDFSLYKYKPDQIGIILSNSESSLYTDREYQKSINNIPSPALFVYTLPNILLGEVCIRNKIMGENIFFINEKFDASAIMNNLDLLFSYTDTCLCITGWVNFADPDNYDSVVYLVRNEKGDDDLLECNVGNLNNIYNFRL